MKTRCSGRYLRLQYPLSAVTSVLLFTRIVQFSSALVVRLVMGQNFPLPHLTHVSSCVKCLSQKEKLLPWSHFRTSGGARSRNLGGHLRGNTHFGGGNIEFHEISPPPSLPKFLTPWIFSIHFFRNFFLDL